MKKIIILICCIAFVFCTGCETTKDKTTFDLYVKGIQEYFENNDEFAVQYQLGLIDINGDDVPDLIIEVTSGSGVSQSIYSIQNNEFTLLCAYGGGFQNTISQNILKAKIENTVMWKLDFEIQTGFTKTNQQNILNVLDSQTVDLYDCSETVIFDDEQRAVAIQLEISYNNKILKQQAIDLIKTPQQYTNEIFSDTIKDLLGNPKWEKADNMLVMETDIYDTVSINWNDISYKSLYQRINILYKNWNGSQQGSDT